MRIEKAILATIALSLGLTAEFSSAGQNPGSSSTFGLGPQGLGANGCVWPANSDPIASLALCEHQTYQVGSDGGGTYFQRVDGVQSLFDNSPGNFHFCMGYYASSTPRQAYVDLNYPVSSTQYPGEPTVKRGITQNDTLCFNFTKGLQYLGQGETMQSRAAMGFTAAWDGARYALEFGYPTNGILASNTIQVKRISPTQWYIEAVPGTIAELVSLKTVKGGQTYTHVGTYSVTFNLTVNAL